MENKSFSMPRLNTKITKVSWVISILNKILIPNRYKPVSTSKTLKYYKDSLHNFLTINLLNYIRWKPIDSEKTQQHWMSKWPKKHASQIYYHVCAGGITMDCGIATFRHAAEERNHMMKILEYILNRGSQSQCYSCTATDPVSK
jgi:hypothetical protein